MHIKQMLAFIVALSGLSACSPYVQIQSFELKFTDSTVITSVELLEHRDLEKGGDTVKPSNGEKIFPILGEKWFKRLEKACKKNNVIHHFTTEAGTSAISLELIFTDPKKIRSFQEDFGLVREEQRSLLSYDFYLVYTEREDSTHLSLRYRSDIFTSSSYISIETPTVATNFFPVVMTIDSLRPERIAANKSYFYPDHTNPKFHIITCSYKNNKLAATSVVKTADDQINLFGFPQNSWMFWCTIIGAVGTVFGIVIYFVKKK